MTKRTQKKPNKKLDRVAERLLQRKKEDKISFDDMAECLLLTPKEMGKMSMSQIQDRWLMLNLPYAEIILFDEDQKIVLFTLGTK